MKELKQKTIEWEVMSKIKAENTEERQSLTAEQIPKKTKKWTDGTGDIVVGDRIKFTEAVFEGSFRKPKFIGERTIIADVVNDSYGEKKQQHTFTIIPIEATGVKAESIKIGQKTTRKGRNIYKNGTDRLLWADESLRKDYVDEKHQRGDEARQIRDERKFGMMNMQKMNFINL